MEKRRNTLLLPPSERQRAVVGHIPAAVVDYRRVKLTDHIIILIPSASSARRRAKIRAPFVFPERRRISAAVAAMTPSIPLPINSPGGLSEP
jgi:hypothetical protein